MGTVRFFSGGRDGGRRSPASDLMRLEIMKKGKLPAADRYKRILKEKLAASRNEALTRLSRGNISKRAETALKEVAAKKAAKEAKILRRMVIVTPRTFSNGRLTSKGKIYDTAGNMVGQINIKNGKMATVGGWSLGQYKPKSQRTDAIIEDAINKYSPYFINLRKMQAMQQGAAQKPGITAWGTQSSNVWGTSGDNVWGTSGDNVWGTSSSDVWGSGEHALQKAASFVMGLFGFRHN